MRSWRSSSKQSKHQQQELITMQDEIQKVNNNIESIYQNMKHDQSGQNDSNGKYKGQREGHSANNSASSQNY